MEKGNCQFLKFYKKKALYYKYQLLITIRRNISARSRMEYISNYKAHTFELNAFRLHWKLIGRIKLEIIRPDFEIFPGSIRKHSL